MVAVTPPAEHAPMAAIAHPDPVAGLAAAALRLAPPCVDRSACRVSSSLAAALRRRRLVAAIAGAILVRGAATAASCHAPSRPPGAVYVVEPGDTSGPSPRAGARRRRPRRWSTHRRGSTAAPSSYAGQRLGVTALTARAHEVATAVASPAVRCPACATLDDKVVDSRASDDGAADPSAPRVPRLRSSVHDLRALEEVPSSSSSDPASASRSTGRRSSAACGSRRRTGQVRRRARGPRRRGRGGAAPGRGRRWSERARRDRGARARSATLDQVAVVRFASVYKGFDDPADFDREITQLTKATAPKRTEFRRRPGADVAEEQTLVVLEQRGRGACGRRVRGAEAVRESRDRRRRAGRARLRHHSSTEAGGDELAVERRSALAQHDAGAELASARARRSTSTPCAGDDHLGHLRRARRGGSVGVARCVTTSGGTASLANSRAAGSRSSSARRRPRGAGSGRPVRRGGP